MAHRYLYFPAWFLLLSFGFAMSSYGQPVQLLPGEVLPIIAGATISAKLASPTADGIFRYQYKVSNPVTSNADVTDVDIDVEYPAQGKELQSAGLTIEGRTSRHVRDKTAFAEKRGIRLIPVGANTPSGWIGGLSGGGYVRWFPRQPVGIQPGQSLLGFAIVSYGLPTVREVLLEPTFQQAPVEEATEENENRLDAIENAILLHLKTVGPTAPPKVFDPVKYIEYILDLKNQSVTLGWIKDAAVSDELGDKLSAISSQLSTIQNQKIPVTTGRQVLELAAQFMQYVEANSCKDFECPVPEGATPKPLTSEAYALLYFNMDYFATQVAKACNVPPPVIEPSPKRQPAKAGQSATADKSSTADRPAPKPSKK